MSLREQHTHNNKRKTFAISFFILSLLARSSFNNFFFIIQLLTRSLLVALNAVSEQRAKSCFTRAVIGWRGVGTQGGGASAAEQPPLLLLLAALRSLTGRCAVRFVPSDSRSLVLIVVVEHRFPCFFLFFLFSLHLRSQTSVAHSTVCV